MSSLSQMPSITAALGPKCKIIIMTANEVTLEPMQQLISDECGFHTETSRFIIVGA